MSKTPEDRIAELEARLAALEPKPPKTEPQYRTLPGQGGVPVNAAGERLLDAPDPAATTTSGSSFGPVWRNMPDGTRQWCPDGLPRNPASGEVIWQQAAPLPAEAGPQRTSIHADQIARVDALFPIIVRPDPEG